jgi:hypothetical protein
MGKPQSTFETFRCNSCNIQRRYTKHMKHVSETLAKTPEKNFDIIANICNIQMKHLQNT